MTKPIILRQAIIDPEFATALKALAIVRARQPAAAFDEQGHLKMPALIMAVGPAMLKLTQMPCFGKFNIEYKTIEVECDSFGNPLPNDELDKLKQFGWQDASTSEGTIDNNKLTLAAIHTIGNSPEWEKEFAQYKKTMKETMDAMASLHRPRIGCCVMMVFMLSVFALIGTAIASCIK